MAADLDLVRRLVAAEHGLAVATTTRADGSVHASLVNAGVLDDPLTGQPAIAAVVRADARKLTLMRRTQRATFVFRSGWEWVAVDGPVTLIGPDDTSTGFELAGLPQLLRDIFKSAGGTHDDWDEFDRVMAREHRTAVLVSPARITSNG
jgi:hypothetical protein